VGIQATTRSSINISVNSTTAWPLVF